MLDALLDDLLRGGDDLRAELALVREDAGRADVARGVDDEVGVLEAAALGQVVGDRDAMHDAFGNASYSRPSVTAATIESMIVTCGLPPAARRRRASR